MKPNYPEIDRVQIEEAHADAEEWERLLDETPLPVRERLAEIENKHREQIEIIGGLQGDLFDLQRDYDVLRNQLQHDWTVIGADEQGAGSDPGPGQEEDAPLARLQDVPLTKVAMAQAGSQLAEYLDANHGPLDSYIKLRALSEMIDAALDGLQDQAMEEADDYGGHDDRVRFGVAFDVRTTYTRYDYGHDETWNSLKEKEKAIAAERKVLEKKMRALMDDSMEGSGAAVANTETGEIMEPARISYRKEGLVVTFPKE